MGALSRSRKVYSVHENSTGDRAQGSRVIQGFTISLQTSRRTSRVFAGVASSSSVNDNFIDDGSSTDFMMDTDLIFDFMPGGLQDI